MLCNNPRNEKDHKIRLATMIDKLDNTVTSHVEIQMMRNERTIQESENTFDSLDGYKYSYKRTKLRLLGLHIILLWNMMR